MAVLLVVLDHAGDVAFNTAVPQAAQAASLLDGGTHRFDSMVQYNQAVQAYNTRIRTFPDAIGAKLIHGAKPRVPFEATAPNADKAPQVNFNLQ